MVFVCVAAQYLVSGLTALLPLRLFRLLLLLLPLLFLPLLLSVFLTLLPCRLILASRLTRYPLYLSPFRTVTPFSALSPVTYAQRSRSVVTLLHFVSKSPWFCIFSAAMHSRVWRCLFFFIFLSFRKSIHLVIEKRVNQIIAKQCYTQVATVCLHLCLEIILQHRWLIHCTLFVPVCSIVATSPL